MVWILFAAMACDDGGPVVVGEAPAGLQLQEVAYTCPELEAGVEVPGLEAAIWHVEACGEGTDGVWRCVDIGAYASVRAEPEGTVLTVRCSETGGTWSAFGLRYLAP